MENVDKMKVAELRAALSERGLDTKGTKPVLLARLKEAIKNGEGKKGRTRVEPRITSLVLSNFWRILCPQGRVL